METKNIGNGNTVIIKSFLLGCIGLVSVIVLDKLYWKTHIIAEGWPDLSPGHLARSLILFVSSLAIFRSFIGSNKPKLILVKSIGLNLETLSLLWIMTSSIIILYLFVFEPSLFNTLSLEDGPFEWATAFLLFGGSVIAAISFSNSRTSINISMLTRISLAVLAVLFFVMAMEEVSWLQRTLKIETPEAFYSNKQQEINLHNFATNHSENIFYFGTFLFLVVAPFMHLLFPRVLSNNDLSVLVPRPYIGVIASIAYAYNFDMWNIIFTQIAFFGSLVIIYAFSIFCGDRKERYIIGVMIFIIVVTQVLFLLNGENFDRLWEVTEYKELLICLALFVYSLDVLAHINREYLPKNS